MPDKYTEKEKELIDLLLRRLWKRKNESGFSYAKLASAIRAKSRITVWRWYRKEKKTYPSQKHIYHMKKFLGYTKV
jgi:hypothetical protein